MEYLKLYPGLLNEFSGRSRRLSEILGESIMQKIEAGLRLEIEPMVLAQWSDWSCGDLLHDVDHAIKEMIEPDGGMVDHKLLRTVDGFRSKPTTEKARELAAELDIAAGNFQENYRPKIDSEMRRGIRRLHEASTLAYLVGTRGRADFFIEGAA
jgi:hypothetical protein